MSFESLLFQAVNGLASASGLFLVAAGLSIIFGVTRIVNMAHGSFYMLGLYLAVTLAPLLGETVGGALGFWGGIVAAALVTAGLGALVEVVLLRRIYAAPELYQLLATFALLLIINDAALYFWGPEDILGPRAPGLSGSVEFLGRHLPQYDIFLALIGPIVLIGLHIVLTGTRFGRLVRAATQDREMVAALGINEAVLFTAVFALGTGIAGLGGALQMAREPANLALDLSVLGDAFVVVVVGGMGSLRGAYLAALLVAEVKALCTALGVVEVAGITFNMSRLTLVAEFLVMAVVLVIRPHGLFGRPQPAAARRGEAEAPLVPLGPRGRLVALAVLAFFAGIPLFSAFASYAPVLALDMVIAALFAASLHLLMGPGGLASFGHAAYFGLGAYGTACAATVLGLPTPLALVIGIATASAGAVLFGWFCVRLEGVYFAMLTLAFAQIVWSIAYQWEEVTGGSNGLFGVWPDPPFDSANGLYLAALAVTLAGLVLIRRLVFAPFGLALRAARDSRLRAEASGIAVEKVRWLAFALAGTLCGAAGGLFAFAKGSISPEAISVGRSIDGLVMVLLGGVNSLTGPLLGAGGLTLLQDMVMRESAYWRALLGLIILAAVLLFPAGLAGGLRRRRAP
ncbi:ABC transporter permease [Ancylobacter dichloromethanicus]|uniref:Branched-chain amino acid ABC transporter permease n=1 Tax=Ancylobacter dichloromethanicus TaxID=518825 RepID=A0A9W6JBC7_9HYPH|nr:ABC transporter permease [Ancylobacter dichloromethanicus]MBS7552134.1 ABC transporter permease [Ancylobacter dichloromethanicus]GLK73867.1 branched-chain amino acid ABC transporter permease [Ancylobacter dichloromethanicus]